ncbi:hypothetical protein ABW19_dt0208167 [Dactylella cylindrospora]|nr:hypothetical protein ABW19_dt0208167 [Dactylella cylindrospora]
MSGETSSSRKPSNDWLIGILSNPEFSDVTVQAGPDGREFKLHRAIICARSGFFKAACKETFQEGLSRQIKLPTVDPNAFESVVKWMYGGGYELPEDFKNSKIVDVYETADYLGVVALKQEIIERITDCFQNDIKRYLDPQGTDELNIKTPFKLMGDLAKSSGSGDFDMLIKPVREIKPAEQHDYFGVS